MDLAALLACLETGEVPLAHRDHAAHLRVAAWAATHQDAPLDGMRVRLHRLLAHHGIETTRESGYHETLTAGVVRVVARALSQDTDGTWDAGVARQGSLEGGA